MVLFFWYMFSENLGCCRNIQATVFQALFLYAYSFFSCSESYSQKRFFEIASFHFGNCCSEWVEPKNLYEWQRWPTFTYLKSIYLSVSRQHISLLPTFPIRKTLIAEKYAYLTKPELADQKTGTISTFKRL